MNRRNFINLGVAGGVLSAFPALTVACAGSKKTCAGSRELSADLVIAGGGLGGFAAAMGALRNGLKVVMTEETDWIGGQITQQGVPPDEHRWIETHGATKLYRDYRTNVRDYYKRNYPLTDNARERQFLNPGNCFVSRICHEPRVALAVMYEMLNPYLSNKQLILLLEYKAVAADVTGDKVNALKVAHVHNKNEIVLNAPYFIDATELGDLLPMTGTEYRRGAESRHETKELHALENEDPENHQAFTLIFAMDYDKDGDHVIEKPEKYEFWRDFVPEMTPPWSGKLLSLYYSDPATLVPRALSFTPEGGSVNGVLNWWDYRKVICRHNFVPGTYKGDISIVNWPQNDYMLGNLDVSDDDFRKHVDAARQLNLSLFYWLQTEVERPDGGQGWPGLRLRGDVLGTEDGMAKYPYVRSSRRLRAMFTILEEHVGKENRFNVSGEDTAADFFDSVGLGHYPVDLHPSTKGDNYIDFPALPFQIPLGALIPQRMTNLLAANKNIGTTHITNGCYRLHPIEWNIGESAGMLVWYALKNRTTPHAVRGNTELLTDFQREIQEQGIEIKWPV